MSAAAHPITRINLKLLQTFLLVAEHSNFREAADRANRSQSAISTQIKQLEAQLGVALFHRTTRRVRLSAEGEELLVSVRRALHEVALGVRTIREMADLRGGPIVVGCSPTIAAARLPAILFSFGQEYPECSVSVRELISPSLFEQVMNGGVDFGIGPVVADVKLSFWPILDDPLFALIPRRLIPETRSSITLRELATVPLLMPSAKTATRHLLEAAGEDMALIPKYQCTRSQTLISMAEAGLGAAILPCSVLPSPIPEDTQVARIVEPTITRQMAIITTPSRVLSPAAARLAELVREMITPRGHLHEAPDAGAHPVKGTERFLPY